MPTVIEDLTERLATVLTGSDPTGPLMTRLLADNALDVVGKHGWHEQAECPGCDEEHCPDESAHDQHAALVEAIQILHRQAHNGATEPLDARRCTREPCATVGGGLAVSADARGLFAPGSRVA